MFLFCKQKTAYDMRMSDWSSDVCSSDLLALGTAFGDEVVVQARGDDAEAALVAIAALLATDMGEAPAAAAPAPLAATDPLRAGQIEIGRASGRERVSHDVDISGGRYTYKKK